MNKQNQSATGIRISGNARIKVGGSVRTSGQAGASVIGVVAKGNSHTIIHGDVVTTNNGTTNHVSVSGGIEISGQGEVCVGGRIIHNGQAMSSSSNEQSGLKFFDQSPIVEASVSNDTTVQPQVGSTNGT